MSPPTVGIPNADTMPVLSMWQPFASLVFAWDRERGDFAKANETRGWCLPSKFIGQPIAIHAAAKFAASRHISGALNDLCYDMFGCGYNFSLPLGAIIGVVRFSAPIPTGEIAPFQSDGELAAGDWTPGRWAFPILEAAALTVPIPAKGRQGWWRYSASAIEARRAGTAKTGPVHESEASEAGDAQ